MNCKLLIILGIILVATSKHLHFTHQSSLYSHQEQPTDDSAPTTGEAPESNASGSQQLFDALKADSSIAGLLNNSRATEADYQKVKSSIVSTLKGNVDLQSKLADEMFGNGSIGALFSNEQRVKILNFVMDNPDIIKSGKNSAKTQVIDFIKNDSELSSIYNANRAAFGG